MEGRHESRRAIKGILLQPKSEWPVIEREPGDAGYLFRTMLHRRRHPAGVHVHRRVDHRHGPLRVGIGLGLLHAVVVYVLTLVGVFVVAYVIDFLAGTFGGQKISTTP